MMRPTRKYVRLFAALVLVSGGGCFSLARDTTPLEQYVLGGVAGGGEAAASTGHPALALGVRRLDLAAYLATPAVVVRRGEHQIAVSEFHRWAEPLDAGINRAIIGHLAARREFQRVDVAPWAPAQQHDYLVQVHVARFEGVAPEDPAADDGAAQVLATWEIIRPADGVVVARGTTDYREQGWRIGDYPGLVAMLDRGVDRLANDMATGVANIPARP